MKGWYTSRSELHDQKCRDFKCPWGDSLTVLTALQDSCSYSLILWKEMPAPPLPIDGPHLLLEHLHLHRKDPTHTPKIFIKSEG